MREFIEREKLLSELRISAEHHVQNSREESLLYRDRNIVKEQPIVAEKDIVKPYLHKLAVQILEKYSGLDICEHLDEYDWDENDISYYKQVGNIGDIMDMIDNVLSEQEKDEQRK